MTADIRTAVQRGGAGMVVKSLAAKQMRRIGFTDRREGYWYYSKAAGGGTTFNLTISKESGRYETLVMNEAFGQPERYGDMRPVYRAQVIANIDVILYELARDGVGIEFDHSEYGVVGQE